MSTEQVKIALPFEEARRIAYGEMRSTFLLTVAFGVLVQNPTEREKLITYLYRCVDRVDMHPENRVFCLDSLLTFLQTSAELDFYYGRIRTLFTFNHLVLQKAAFRLFFSATHISDMGKVDVLTDVLSRCDFPFSIRLHVLTLACRLAAKKRYWRRFSPTHHPELYFRLEKLLFLYLEPDVLLSPEMCSLSSTFFLFCVLTQLLSTQEAIVRLEVIHSPLLYSALGVSIQQVFSQKSGLSFTLDPEFVSHIQQHLLVA